MRNRRRVPGCCLQPPAMSDGVEAVRLAVEAKPQRRFGAWLLAAWSLASPTGIVWAGPVADAALAGRTPTVTTTASGQALVNIAAPNAAGLSHNRYQRFDVDANGLLLNNSRSPISTALGTQIAAPIDIGTGDLSFTNSATLEAWRDLHLTVGGALTNSGQLLAGNDLTVNAGSLSNSAGTLEAGRDLALTAGSLANGGGSSSTTYVAYSLAGYVSNVLAYVADPLVQLKLFNEAPPDWFWKNSRVTLNNRYSLYLDSGLSAPVFTLTLTRAGAASTLSAGRNLSASTSGTLSNQSSLITAGGDIRITADRFDNLAGTDIADGNIFAGGGGHELRAYTAAGTLTQAAGSVSITAPTQTNSGTLTGASAYLGGSALTNGLTDYRYATPANTLPAAWARTTAAARTGIGITSAPCSMPITVSGWSRWW